MECFLCRIITACHACILKTVKLIFLVILAVAVVIAGVFSFKSLAEIAEIIDKCRNDRFATIDKNKLLCVDIGEMSRFDIKDKKITDLCGCINSNEKYYLAGCCIIKNDNRLLVISLKYSSVVYYSCTVPLKYRRYTDCECINTAERILFNCVPEELCNKKKTYLALTTPAEHGVLCEFRTGEERDTVKICVRYDTLRVCYFDAREIYLITNKKQSKSA